jgi:hypothetical protein
LHFKILLADAFSTFRYCRSISEVTKAFKKGGSVVSALQLTGL